MFKELYFYKAVFFLCLLASAFGSTSVCRASAEHETVQKTAPTIKAALVESLPLEKGKPSLVTISLKHLNTGDGVYPNELEVVHTERIHILTIEPQMNDYHHVHPKPNFKPGEYVFSFTPHTECNYRVWIDIKPVGGDQQILSVDLPGATACRENVERDISFVNENEKYRFEISLLNKPYIRQGDDIMARVKVTEKLTGEGVEYLQPYLGAFMHLVGFYEGLYTIMHVHPMGKEPQAHDDRGGPYLDVHLNPEKTGYVRFYAQFRIDGKIITVPFGVFVES